MSVRVWSEVLQHTHTMFQLLAAFLRYNVTVPGCSIGCVLHRQNTTDERSLGVVDLFALPFAFLSHYQVVETHVTIDHVMPREKRRELWTAVSGLLALISKSYRNFSLWHHEFIKAKLSTALVVSN